VNLVTTRMGMFQSRPESWRKARAFIEGFCKGAGLPKDSTLRANLVIEELFLNTVKHGHKGGSEAPVWIRLSAAGGRMSLSYEDRAAPFNPFPADREAMLKKIERDRTEGGLGVILAHELADSARYDYLFGRNRIQLTLED